MSSSRPWRVRGAETTVQEVATLMINLRISRVPVLDQKTLGVATKKSDLLSRAETGTERRRSRGASGSPQIPDWLPNTSNRTPGEWRTS